MPGLPAKITLNDHSRQRLQERKDINEYYNTKNLMKSGRKWYGRNDLLQNSALYLHSLYVCRKSKNKLRYMTDGKIEVIYDKVTGVAITVMEVKEKFLPIEQYIKPSVLKEKENKMGKIIENKTETGYCPDCEKENVDIIKNGVYAGVCDTCRRRKQNSKARGLDYIPFKDLPEEQKSKITAMQLAQAMRKKDDDDIEETIPAIAENYYQAKAENSTAYTMNKVERPQTPNILTPVVNNVLSDQTSFMRVLKECGCEIDEETMKDILNVLVNTDKLKDVFMTVAESNCQQAILDLEQGLNVAERKLQHDWEYNGFQEVDDIKFKGFLTWRRVLKGAIFFWKKLYQTNALIELQRAWNAYTDDPTDKIVLAGDRDRTASNLKRFQITTESISTILNSRRPFTRVFYAETKEDAYNMFIKWMSDRQLRENKSKTTIVELSTESEDGRKEN